MTGSDSLKLGWHSNGRDRCIFVVLCFGLADLFRLQVWNEFGALGVVRDTQINAGCKEFLVEQNGLSVYARFSSWKVVLIQALHFLLRLASSYLRLCLLWACTVEQRRLFSTIWMGSFISLRPLLKNPGGRARACVCVCVCHAVFIVRFGCYNSSVGESVWMGWTVRETSAVWGKKSSPPFKILFHYNGFTS